MTVLGASSTASPARTRAYDRTPPTLTADTADGTCSSSPTMPATAVRTWSSVSWAVDAADTCVPSASSVVVASPSRMVAR